MNVLGKTSIEIVTMDGSHKYTIKQDQGQYLYLNETTLLGESLRFDKPNHCVEIFNEDTKKWDIYIGDYSITQVNLY